MLPKAASGITAPFSRLSTADGFDLGPAKGREAVPDGNADLDHAVEIS
jgi:hypothetical protein